jgi:hypothetical protein
MTILARILWIVGLVVLAYVIFFSKPREITVMEPQVQPQIEQVSKPQPPARPRSRSKPQPADNIMFEPENQQPVFRTGPENNEPIFRALQPQPKPAQSQRRRAAAVYEWEATFNAAMDETDRSKRQERIDAAQTAINRRIVQLNAGDDSPEERQAIRNAQLGLNLLREEVSSNNGQSRR